MPSRRSHTHASRWGLALVGALAPPLVALASPAMAQDSVTAKLPDRADRDLSTRYLLRELYSLEELQGQPTLSQYQVAYHERVRLTQDAGEGKAEAREFVYQARFTERPARPFGTGATDPSMIFAVVRRYESAAVEPDLWTRLGDPAFMEGAELWIKSPGRPNPPIMVLTPGRELREHEYRFAAGNPFVPAYAAVLPTASVRLRDTWAVPRAAASALLGEPAGDGDLTARLVEIGAAPAEAGPRVSEVAQIDVEGQVPTAAGTTRVRGRLTFAYQPTAAPGPDQPIRAFGGLLKVRLAQVTRIETVEGRPGGEQRRELILERRWPGQGTALNLPENQPTPTPENSWLTYIDPRGRFAFRHPQSFPIDARAGSSTDALTLVRHVGDSPELVVLAPREGPAPLPDVAFQETLNRRRDAGFEILPGTTLRLPADGWPGVRSVDRVEATMTPNEDQRSAVPGVKSIHFDGYLVVLDDNHWLAVEALTAQPGVQAFRDEVEAMLKTFRLTRTEPASATDAKAR
jgi:hypothetical protein